MSVRTCGLFSRRLAPLIAVGALAWNGCKSNDPTNILVIYNLVYALEVDGTEYEVTGIHWTAADGTETTVPMPPAGWNLPMLAFSGDVVGLRLDGFVRNGQIRITFSATSPGVTGITGTDSCSDDVGTLTTCTLTLSQSTLP